MVNRREHGVFKWTCLYQKPSCRGEILTFQPELCTPYPSYSSEKQHTIAGTKIELVLPYKYLIMVSVLCNAGENNMITYCSYSLPLGSLNWGVFIVVFVSHWGLLSPQQEQMGIASLCLPHLNPTCPVCGMELAPEEQVSEGVETQLQTWCPLVFVLFNSRSS